MMYILTDLDTGKPLDSEGEFAKGAKNVPVFETRKEAVLFAINNWIEFYSVEKK